MVNHANSIITCDFCFSVKATFRVLYVFVVIEHERRRLAEVNVTANPKAEWKLQQLHQALGEGAPTGIASMAEIGYSLSTWMSRSARLV